METFFARQRRFVSILGAEGETAQLGNFTFREFESTDALFAYIADGQYGYPDMPAVCFGFKVIEYSESDYELELFFNDLSPREYTAIPDQKDFLDQTNG